MTTDNKKYGTIKFSDTTQGRIVDMAEEQKAWDMFAAAALQGLISGMGLAQRFVAHECNEAANYADRMMEQRKARM